MKLLLIDQWRKHIKNPLYFLITGLFFFVIIASFITTQTMLSRLEEPLDDYLQEQNVQDFHITLGQIQYQHLTGQQAAYLCDELDITNQCLFAEGFTHLTNTLNQTIHEKLLDRPDLVAHVHDTIVNEIVLLFSGNVTIEKGYSYTADDGDFTFRFMSVNETISLPYIHQGRLPETVSEIAIFESFANANNLSINDTLEIRGTPYTITGFFYASDFVFPAIHGFYQGYNPVYESMILVQKDFFTELRESYTVRLYGKGDIFILQDTFNASEIFTMDLRNITQSTGLFTTNKNLNMIQTVVPRTYNINIAMIALEIDNTRVFSELYLTLFIALCMVLTLMVLKRFIDKQKDDFTLYKTLGYTDHQLAVSTLLFGLMLFLIIVLSASVGYQLSDALFHLYSARYHLPKAPLRLDSELIFTTVILPSIFLFGALYIYARFVLYTLRPKDKYSSYTMLFTLSKQTFFQAILFVFAAVLLLFGLSANRTIDDFQTTMLEGNHFENMVYLRNYRNTPTSDAEPFTTTRAIVYQKNTQEVDEFNVQAYGIPQETSLKRLLNDDVASNALLADGIIITAQLAHYNAISTGDTLTFLINNKTITRTVKGIHNDLVERAVYFDQATLNYLLGFDAPYYNGYYSSQSVIDDADAFRVLNYFENSARIERLFRLSNTLLSVLMVLSLALSLSMFGFLTVMRLESASRALATLKALGYDSLQSYFHFFKETLFLLVATFTLAIGITIKITQTIIEQLTAQLDYVFVARTSLLATFIAFVIITALILILTFVLHYVFDQEDLSSRLKKA